ncbi:cation diffusion facilitator family transporter [Alkalicoccus chagannorensis]|uniref:cation diffusion facilitator family transporter n=1 Tax=Alkalicoccus chagannorensis TaxID=427072 RepID=UPI0004163D44|nr:cation transporter [Alkalicoccus chagannorensis]
MNEAKEKNVLWMSVIAAILFSGAGIVFGLLFQSQMILFDGLYSLISVGLSYLSLLAASFMSKADWERYPFGKDMVQPLVILVKYTVILLLVLASLTAAAVAVLQGGRMMDVGPSFVYSLIGMAACAGVWLYLRWRSVRGTSALVKAESDQWMMDSMISVAVAVGFLVAFLMEQTGTATALVPYVDPVMVILVSVYFLRFPLKEMKAALAEVLEMRPSDEVRQDIAAVVSGVEEAYAISETFLRVTKVGRTIWVEVDFVAEPDTPLDSLRVQDQIREQIASGMNGLAPKKWMTVSFMHNRRWAVEE